MAVRSWLHGRPANTAAAYGPDAQGFLAHCQKPLAEVTLADVQAWQTSMGGAAISTVARRLSAVKSLLSHAYQIGLIASDVGRLVKVTKATDGGADHIVAEASVTRMIGAEGNATKRALLRLLYVLGLRASEAAGLRWRHITRLKRGASVEVLGKGNKVRTTLIPQPLLDELAALTPNPRPDSPVIPSRDGGAINRQIAWRWVKTAAKRVGLDERVSTHWLRHSHASHALDNGARVHEVQQSLGHASLATTTKYAHVRDGHASSNYVGGTKNR